MNAIATERLLLHPLSVEDADDMVEVLAAPSLYEFTGGEPPTLEALRDRYRRQVAGSGDPEEEWRNWIVRDAVGAASALGFVQATITARSAELAWVIGVEAQGRGVATEAVRAVRDQLSAEGIERFEAFIHPTHAASQGVARNAGLTNTHEVDDDGEERWAWPAPPRSGTAS